MNKQEIKDVVKEMIHNGEIKIKILTSEYCWDFEKQEMSVYDIKDIISDCCFELEVDDV